MGTDILALVLSGSTRFSGWEVNGDVDFGRRYLAVDYGRSSRDEILQSGGTYHNDGSYWRAGVDLNLLRKDPDRNMFFFGFRYARSSYSETVFITTSDPYYGALQYQLVNPSASAAWGELVTGIRVKVWKEFWMGFTSRMKFALSISGADAVASYNVPGYGVTSTGNNWGFSYQVFWRIPFGKESPKKLSVP